MPFSYQRTIHFRDTDAAGVVFFANYLAICHEAYEEAVGAAGIDLRTFFADTGTVVPIARSEAEYLRPFTCGDKVRVTLTPRAISADSFQIAYDVFRLGPPDKLAARIRTEHVCITSQKRERTSLPPVLATWVAAG